jgi:hypothetical protein
MLNGDTVISTKVKVGESTDLLVWHLRHTGGNYKVIDLIVGKKDLLVILHQRFNKVLTRDGYKGLIAWINNKQNEAASVNNAGTTDVSATGGTH